MSEETQAELKPDGVEAPPSRTRPPAREMKQKPRWKTMSESAFGKTIAVSDFFAGYMNNASQWVGGERFVPSSNDFVPEVEKCVHILQNFTRDGVAVPPPKEEAGALKYKLQSKVVKKIPPQVIRDARGICIYSSMKMALPPFGGMNGTGLLMGRLPDGSWSAPSSICPNYYSAGLVVGFDLVDIILIINSDEMLESFKSHKFSITAETHISSGPLGAAYAGAVDIKRNPSAIYSYVHSRGFYAGFELTGQVFLDRFDENERAYYWPGIKAGDILAGKVRIPEVENWRL
ncbi:hypothetical protein MSPP1_001767 [Malassezia sp. CBS 17886]|nr:hypothetical protein MSPP1_001767 [Malassezia sp. CBS 17886]